MIFLFLILDIFTNFNKIICIDNHHKSRNNFSKSSFKEKVFYFDSLLYINNKWDYIKKNCLINPNILKINEKKNIVNKILIHKQNNLKTKLNNYLKNNLKSNLKKNLKNNLKNNLKTNLKITKTILIYAGKLISEEEKNLIFEKIFSYQKYCNSIKLNIYIKVIWVGSKKFKFNFNDISINRNLKNLKIWKFLNIII